MKYLPILLILSTISAPVFSDEGYLTAAGSAAKYSGNVISDNAGDISNSLQDATRAVAKPTKSFLASIWGYISDAGNGIEKQKALATGDGVAINASVYSLALREAERKNEPLNQVKSKRDETQYALKRSQDEAKRLEDLAKAYKEDANNFGRNINTTLQEIASTATRLEGWDKQKQVKLSKLLDEHKKLGVETAKDGDARHAGHTLTSLSETFAELETAVLKSPDQAQSIGLGGRLGAMKSLLQGAATRMGEKETQMLQSTRRLNELAQIDDKALAETQDDMQRKMVLGTLNNAVNNLITQAEYSKNRAQMAFSHFDDIEKELGVKGVRPGDLKKHYRDDKNLLALTNTYNNSPVGVYVNSQISKALGSVCELVNNQCKDGTNTNLFNFLDDSSRSIFKDRLITPGSIEVDAGTTDK